MRNLALMWVLSGVLSFAAVQADTVQSWESGETTVTLTDDGTLRVSGNGAMKDHYYYFSISDPEEYRPQWCRYSLKGRPITKAVIGDSVTHIGQNAFSYCFNLTSITIGNSVASIGNWAFDTDCDNRTSIEVAADNAHYSSEDGILFNKNKTTLIRHPGCIQGSYVIPDGVTHIGNEAFAHNTKLTSVVIPDGVTSIGEQAFYECFDLTSVTIGNSVASIGKEAFAHNDSLTSITIPNSVTSIGELAFRYNRGLTSVTIGNSVASIGTGAFLGCGNLTSIEIAADNAHYISEDGVIFNKNKTALIHYPMSRQGPYVIPNSVMFIDDWVFYECDGLTSVTFPKNLKIIGEYAFRNCFGLTSVTIPKSVRIIGREAFYACTNLMSVTILNGVPSIGDNAFSYCKNLTTVTIAGSVRLIGAEAFKDCDSLKLITFHGLILPKFGYGAFEGGILPFHTEVYFSNREWLVSRILPALVLSAAVLVIFIIIIIVRKSRINKGEEKRK